LRRFIRAFFQKEKHSPRFENGAGFPTPQGRFHGRFTLPGAYLSFYHCYSDDTSFFCRLFLVVLQLAFKSPTSLPTSSAVLRQHQSSAGFIGAFFKNKSSPPCFEKRRPFGRRDGPRGAAFSLPGAHLSFSNHHFTDTSFLPFISCRFPPTSKSPTSPLPSRCGPKTAPEL
jgi:hypothetical protein